MSRFFLFIFGSARVKKINEKTEPDLDCGLAEAYLSLREILSSDPVNLSSKVTAVDSKSKAVVEIL